MTPGMRFTGCVFAAQVFAVHSGRYFVAYGKPWLRTDSLVPEKPSILATVRVVTLGTGYFLLELVVSLR
jgi:hypothetical protein